MNHANNLLQKAEYEAAGAWNTENRVSVAFLIAVILVIGIALLGARALRRSEESRQWLVHTFQVLRTLDEVHAAASDAVANGRGFILSGNAAALEQRDMALSIVESRLQALRGLVADNEVQVQAVVALGKLVDARIDLERAITVTVQAQGIAAARGLLLAQRDDTASQRLRHQFEAMSTTELRLLDERAQRDDRERRDVIGWAGALLAAVIATVLIGLMKLRQELRLRRALADTLRANHTFLMTVLDNLPSQIYVLDPKTLRYLAVNRATEAWIARPRKEILGQTAETVMSADSAGNAIAADREALLNADGLTIPEDSRIAADGRIRTFNTRKIIVRDDGNQPRYLVSISHDISERVAQDQQISTLNEDLQRQQTSLKAANRELDSFCYSVSHDLRSPLRAIDGFSLMLLEDYGEQLDSEARRYLDTIRQSSERMSQLIDDLLSFSRLGRSPLVNSVVDMHALAATAAEEALQGTDKPPHTVSIDPLPAARGDSSLLGQVWRNLVSNAVKYTGKTTTPEIRIGARAGSGELEYYVSDNGAGFDMQYAHKLFAVFQRLHGQEEFAGTGVGLAIVHRVISRHGGRVWAEGAPGRGATFHFTLPVEA